MATLSYRDSNMAKLQIIKLFTKLYHIFIIFCISFLSNIHCGLTLSRLIQQPLAQPVASEDTQLVSTTQSHQESQGDPRLLEKLPPEIFTHMANYLYGDILKLKQVSTATKILTQIAFTKLDSRHFVTQWGRYRNFNKALKECASGDLLEIDICEPSHYFYSKDNEQNPLDLSLLEKCTNLQKLSITAYGLTQIPQQISSLTHLKRLNLRGNSLHNQYHLESISQKLEDLSLPGCDLTQLPEWLRSLNNLKNLWIVHNDFSSPDVHWEYIPTSVQDLGLNDCNMRKLPEELRNFKKLRKLHLVQNSAIKMKADWTILSQLPDLELVDLRGRKMTTRPAEIPDKVKVLLTWQDEE
jgi:Leucine-rich repeat (LRR) protein